MKLLFDQNVSPFLCSALADLFPSSIHVREVGLREATDAVIWDYAAQEGFAIVTKDSDYRQRSFLRGHPPKIIWLRVGNCSTETIEALLRKHAIAIGAFLLDEEKSFLSLA